MSLETEKIILESKINKLKATLESKKIEGEMFVEQVRNELSPYIEFVEIDRTKANVAFQQIITCLEQIDQLTDAIKTLQRKL